MCETLQVWRYISRTLSTFIQDFYVPVDNNVSRKPGRPAAGRVEFIFAHVVVCHVRRHRKGAGLVWRKPYAIISCCITLLLKIKTINRKYVVLNLSTEMAGAIKSDV